MKGYLVLEDGTVFEGRPFGAVKDAFGEVVFSTGMTGYQESLTDPSYAGQILTSSYPMIGNYGVNAHDNQSEKVQVWGYVVNDLCEAPSHRHCNGTMDEFLKRSDVPGISGVDTRALIRKLRTKGTMKGAITKAAPEDVIAEVRRMDNPDRENLVATVSTPTIQSHITGKDRSVVVIDCGVKDNIIRELSHRFDVHQVPYSYTADDIRELEPDGVFVTNGPGDPAHEGLRSTVVATLAELKDELPMMGICLGNQLLALMFGASTYKLKFGHRGVNQPVGYGRRVFVTSQNHGFAVDGSSATAAGMEITFQNLNDGTVEGMRHSELPVFSVQFHPEARPGPHDTTFLFDEFARMLEEGP